MPLKNVDKDLRENLSSLQVYVEMDSLTTDPDNFYHTYHKSIEMVEIVVVLYLVVAKVFGSRKCY